MKTQSIPHHSGVSRAIKGVIALIGLVASTAAHAATLGQVNVILSHGEFANGKNMHLTSGASTIYASTVYTYKLTAKCKGKAGTPLAKLIPPGTPLEDFIESISPGGSKFLKGTFSNPSGTLPATLLNKTFAGTKTVKGLGRVKISLTVVGKVLANGQCVMDVTNVKFNTTPKQNLGSVTIMVGSKLFISSAPVITFLRPGILVNEPAGTVNVPVWRMQNRHGISSVHYATVAGTAAEGTDFTPTSGDLDFKDGDATLYVPVKITNNTINDGIRSFTVVLSNAGDGAVLGNATTITVNIHDDD